jgi:creatinine amidohydrolase
MEAELRNMTTPDVVEAVRERRIPVIPVATLETHDPHLPVEVDVVLAEEVVLAAARSRPDVFLAAPVVPYGYTEHTMDFPGAVTIRPQVLLDYYYDVGESFVRHGFRRILFVNGHGSNVNVMNLAVRLLTVQTPADVAATSVWDLCRDALDRERASQYPGGMAHACEYETSLYSHLAPDKVRGDLIEDCFSSLNNEWTYTDTRGAGPIHFVPWWSQSSANGTEGTPSLATPEKGRIFFDAAAQTLIRFGEHFKHLELPGRSDRRDGERWDPSQAWIGKEQA